MACLASIVPGARGLLISDLCLGLCIFFIGFSNHLALVSQDEPLSLLSPIFFPEHLAPSPPAPNHCSFFPQVYRPRKQPPCSNIPCNCDAGYSPDFTAKYHGSSYDAHMSQRSQVSQLLRRHTPLWGVGRQKNYFNLDCHLLCRFLGFGGHKVLGPHRRQHHFVICSIILLVLFFPMIPNMVATLQSQIAWSGCQAGVGAGAVRPITGDCFSFPALRYIFLHITSTFLSSFFFLIRLLFSLFFSIITTLSNASKN